jgi:hypothetical protein
MLGQSSEPKFSNRVQNKHAREQLKTKLPEQSSKQTCKGRAQSKNSGTEFRANMLGQSSEQKFLNRV